eukprot:6188960-Pleurochrysis_carterae.AAC.4
MRERESTPAGLGLRTSSNPNPSSLEIASSAARPWLSTCAANHLVTRNVLTSRGSASARKSARKRG